MADHISVPPDMVSDGCTMSKVLKKLLGGERYVEYCREHDFLRRYAIVNPIKANWILAKRIWKHGLIGKLRSPLYFLATTITYPFYRHTKPLPTQWEIYADHYR